MSVTCKFDFSIDSIDSMQSMVKSNLRRHSHCYPLQAAHLASIAIANMTSYRAGLFCSIKYKLNLTFSPSKKVVTLADMVTREAQRLEFWLASFFYFFCLAFWHWPSIGLYTNAKPPTKKLEVLPPSGGNVPNGEVVQP